MGSGRPVLFGKTSMAFSQAPDRMGRKSNVRIPFTGDTPVNARMSAVLAPPASAAMSKDDNKGRPFIRTSKILRFSTPSPNSVGRKMPSEKYSLKSYFPSGRGIWYEKLPNRKLRKYNWSGAQRMLLT